MRKNPQHPAFDVYIDVSHHFFFEEVPENTEDVEPDPAPAPVIEDGVLTSRSSPDPTVGKPVLVRVANGKLNRKILRPFETETTVRFPANMITTIMDERDAAQALEAEHAAAGRDFSPIVWMSFNQVAAQHLKDAAMRDAAPHDKWLSIRVPANPALEKYLNVVFETKQPETEEEPS